MLDNSITFAVDIANNGTTVNQTYTRYLERENNSVYAGTDHSSGAQNLITFYRTFPKPQGNSKGVERTSFKVSDDTVVLGADGLAQLTKPVIIKIDINRPVGISDADFLAIRMRACAILASTSVTALTNGLNI